MICIHHNDLDGRCSAAIVKYRFSPRYVITFIEMDYSYELDLSKIKKDEYVYIVDFSLKPDVIEKLLAITKKVVWIDHHVTAKEYPYQFLDGLRDFENKSMAGCELTWKYLFPDILMPIAISYIGDYDKWALKYEPECFQFHEGMKLLDNKPTSENWFNLFNIVNARYKKEVTAYYLYIDRILKAGKLVITYRDNYCSDLRNLYGYETEIFGYKAYACNQYLFGSKGFGEKFNEYQVCLAYVHTGNGFIVSLYSKNVDVSVIAKYYGGGGHKGAAGFNCIELPWKKSK